MENVIETYLGGVHEGVTAAASMVTSAAITSSSSEPDDIPRTTNDPVWILGKQYSATQELDLIRRDVQSRIWCTYRRGFVPIGNPQYTSDRGWGCMLRCGQMILAQSLIGLHLGREWYWTSECKDPTYLKIIKKFEDNRQNPFSIHTIALMGDSEDKQVGEWFGPNTVSQVLKKLVQYDDWCKISIHVALDNMIIIDEILNSCIKKNEDDENNENVIENWKPLLLIIPLRLGLTEVNPIYINGLKKCFELSYSVGMIGGRPNQALYFIGYVGDEALYLDPHTTQRHGSVGNKVDASEIEMDETFHQKYAARINFTQMDPSLALAFLCRTRDEFDDLCQKLEANIVEAGIQPLFEIAKTGCTPYISQQATGSSLHNRTTDEHNPIQTAGSFQDDFEELGDCTKDQSDEDFEFLA